MSDHLHDNSDPMQDYFFEEIMSRDETLESVRLQIRQFNTWLAEGAVDYGSPEFDDVYTKLQDTWSYYGVACEVAGKLRPIDPSDATTNDDGELLFIPEPSLLLISHGIEAVPNESGGMEVVYLFGKQNETIGIKYYGREEDIFALNFEKIPHESIVWQLERLLPSQTDMIKQLVPEDGTLVERLRGLDDLHLIVDQKQFDKYPVLEHLAQYIDKKVGIDHRIIHNLTINGEITVESTMDDGVSGVVCVDITNDPLTVAGYVPPIALAEHHDAAGNVSFVPRLSVFVHSDREHDENDEEIGLESRNILEIKNLRPAKSLGRLLREHAKLLGMTVENGGEITLHADSPVEVEPLRRPPSYFERIRYLQTLIDASLLHVSDRASQQFETFEDARDAAAQLHTSVATILREDLGEIAQHTFVADGTGISLPNYLQDGPTMQDGETSGALTFHPDPENQYRSNVLMDQYFVEITGEIRPTVFLTADANEKYYKAGIDMVVKIIDGRAIYRQHVPGSDRIAKEISVQDYAYVPLDGSASLELIDIHDARRFKMAMDSFKARLVEMPDLIGSYNALKQLHRALYNERDDGEFTELQRIQLLQLLGEQGGGDSAASQIIVDTLSDLLGPKRRISVRGAIYRDGKADDEPVEGEIAGIVTNVVSMRPGGTTEEPMLVMLPTGINTTTIYVPLKDLKGFDF